MRGVFVADCDCGALTTKLAHVETFKTDRAAIEAAWEHWLCRHADNDHRYWIVHGPSGHLIALHDTPLGRLPP